MWRVFLLCEGLPFMWRTSFHVKDFLLREGFSFYVKDFLLCEGLTDLRSRGSFLKTQVLNDVKQSTDGLLISHVATWNKSHTYTNRNHTHKQTAQSILGIAPTLSMHTSQLLLPLSSAEGHLSPPVISIEIWVASIERSEVRIFLFDRLHLLVSLTYWNLSNIAIFIHLVRLFL